MYGSVLKLVARKHCTNIVLCRNGLHLSATVAGPKVAVVLSGCGVYDGSEIHESSAILVHLSRAQADTTMFAPNIQQMHTIDHMKGEPMEPDRNVLIESARIARGKVKDLAELHAELYDAVIFPGGFGAAKNLSTFAIDGTNMKINGEVERVLREFHVARKPIGLCCIAPVLAAKVIHGCEVTVGKDKDEGRWPYGGTVEAVQKLGAINVPLEVDQHHVDKKNKIVTTPAFMCETAFHHIFDGIGKMVDGVLKLVK
ncbi:hypothetical protein CHS0354_038138 [Potamilus streckersoni]|uniref:Uncharacterized protein n=1 Tax=Potamilus streckersoni TaxID=2493646 RepID=A0AAE0SKA7_9BIVA|nr:hypothetical protein CHS0354_038138 [Potamilus streckersoni]